MCDSGMDGDMWDPTTASGKSVYSRPYHTSDGLRWKPEPLVLRHVEPEQPTFWSRLRRAAKILVGKER